MIYELRTYTVKPGTLGDMVKAASTVSRDIRKDEYGKLEGYWSTEIGPLNQVMHMWSYGDYEERAKLRAELSKHGVGMTGPLGFANNYALGMKRTRAQELRIGKISDLRAHPELRIGFSNEFVTMGPPEPRRGTTDALIPLRARLSLSPPPTA